MLYDIYGVDIHCYEKIQAFSRHEPYLGRGERRAEPYPYPEDRSLRSCAFDRCGVFYRFRCENVRFKSADTVPHRLEKARFQQYPARCDDGDKRCGFGFPEGDRCERPADRAGSAGSLCDSFRLQRKIAQQPAAQVPAKEDRRSLRQRFARQGRFLVLRDDDNTCGRSYLLLPEDIRYA